MFKNCLSSFFLMLSLALFSQSTTVVKGKVSNQDRVGIVGAEIFIEGTNYLVYTGDQGDYRIELVAGTYHINIASIGYEDLTQEFTISEGEAIDLSVQLKPTKATNLDGITIVANKSKESETALLLEQKNASVISESIGIKELERKGVSDVATAVTKVSGISKQEGSSVIYVRGLGDRYNSTTMNDLPIPSNDPEYKNIDLSLFSTDILSSVGIDKVFSGNFYGDFAGGNININSKRQSGKRFLSLGMTTNLNSNAINHPNFRLQSGIHWFGFDQPKNPMTLNSFGFENSLNPKKSGALGSGFSIALGDRYNIGQNGKFSVYLTANHDNQFSSISNGFLKSGVNAQGEVQGKDFEVFNSFQYQTNTTGYLNLNYQINRQNNLTFNSLSVNSSQQKLEEGEGYMRDNANEGGLQRRGTYVRNQLLVNQLLGEHQFSERTQLSWALGYNTILSDMPDRFQNVIEWKSNLNHYVVANSSASLNHRYFQQLNEDEIVAKLVLDFKFAQNEDTKYRGKLNLGYNGRVKKRDFEAMQYNLAPANGQMYVDFNHIDGFYNQENYQNGFFNITTFSGSTIEPQFYEGEQTIQGGFANLEYKLTPKFTAILGLRAEILKQSVTWNTSLDPIGDTNEMEEFQFLPSLNLKYELNPLQNLRFATSKTYTLPQFKERALFMYEELGETAYGWPTTYASTDYNADLKWEFFPTQGELFSITAFGKYIENPINKFTVASSTNDISYTNTGDWGYVYGAEFEIRKSVYKSDSQQPIQFTAGANASYAYSHQELNNDKVFRETKLSNGTRLNANFTHQEDRFQGASDWLVNGDVSFSKIWSNQSQLMMTLAYNYFSDRIYALGTDGRGNIVEKGIGSLDFVVRAKVNQNLGFNLNAKNLLNPNYQRVQENIDQNIIVMNYKRGYNLSFGVNYQF